MAENQRRMGLLYDELVEDTSTNVADSMLSVQEALIRRNPKDSGASAKSWRNTVGELDMFTPVITEQQALARNPIAEAEQVLDGYSIFDGDIIIFNRRDYIEELEEGHSRQAPRGFVEQAIEEGLANAD